MTHRPPNGLVLLCQAISVFPSTSLLVRTCWPYTDWDRSADCALQPCRTDVRQLSVLLVNSSCIRNRPPAAEFQPNSPKNNRWPKIRRKKMRLAENPPNRKISAAAENNCGLMRLILHCTILYYNNNNAAPRRLNKCRKFPAITV